LIKETEISELSIKFLNKLIRFVCTKTIMSKWNCRLFLNFLQIPIENDKYIEESVTWLNDVTTETEIVPQCKYKSESDTFVRRLSCFVREGGCCQFERDKNVNGLHLTVDSWL